MNRETRILVIGYGNPGRQDDGLGPALAELLEAQELPGVTVQSDYQLTVEDAVTVAEHDVVVFVDASVTGEAPFDFTPVTPTHTVSFSSHSVTPSMVLGLAHALFAAETRGYVLGIRGYQFDTFGESLSPRAQTNLDAALRALRTRLADALHEHRRDLVPSTVERARDK